MSDQDNQILNSRFMMWFTIVIVPIAGIVLTVYDVFLREEPINPQDIAAIAQKNQGKHQLRQQQINKLKEIKKIQDPFKAYVEYKFLAELAEDKAIKKMTEREMKSIALRLQENFDNLLANGKRRELKKHMTQTTTIYTEAQKQLIRQKFQELKGGQDKIAKRFHKLQKNMAQKLQSGSKSNLIEIYHKYENFFQKNSNMDDELREEIEQSIADIVKKIAICSNQANNTEYTTAEELCQNFLQQHPELEDSAKKEIENAMAKIYFQWGEVKLKAYQLLKNEIWLKDAETKFAACNKYDHKKRYQQQIKLYLEK